MLDKFGSWVKEINKLSTIFNDNKPFPNILINNFFAESYADEILKAFPNPRDEGIMTYWNPIEKKHVMNNFMRLPTMHDVFNTFNSTEFINTMRNLTGIDNLEADPHLHGAGVHMHPRGGKLDLHVDYSIHPITKKERRINIIVYMNKEWQPEWHGCLELWSKNEFGRPLHKEVTVIPSFNTAVIFQTSDDSLHGLPTPIACPEGKYRQSLAVYYVSEPRPSASPRSKAEFVSLPGQPVSAGLEKLYQIRGHRLITQEDLNEYFADWQTHPDGAGYWY